jgi:hypothetical protein
MWGYSTASVCLLVSLGFGPGSMAQNSQKPAPRVLELTPEKNEKDLKVRVGDEIVLKLPAQLPFNWGLTEEATALKEIKVPVKVAPVGQAGKSDQVVGAPRTSGVHYEVVAMPKKPTVQWVYCYQGRAIVNGVAIQPTEPLKPDQLPTKKGTYFRIKLVPLD